MLTQEQKETLTDSIETVAKTNLCHLKQIVDRDAKLDCLFELTDNWYFYEWEENSVGRDEWLEATFMEKMETVTSAFKRVFPVKRNSKKKAKRS